MMSSTATVLELWIQFGLAVMLTVARLAARIYSVGVAKLMGHDYFAALILTFYGVQCTFATLIEHVFHQFMAELRHPELDFAKITTLKDTVSLYGYVSEVIYILFIYGAKASLLFYYSTFNYTQAWQQRRVLQFTAVLIAVSFVVVMGIILGHCRPFSDHFRSQNVGSGKCNSAPIVPWSIYISHLVSDIALLLVPIPVLKVLWEVHLPLARKMFLVAMIFSGFFTIASATIVFAEFLHNGDVRDEGAWARREQFVWILLLNTPALMALFKTELLASSMGGETSLQLDGLPQDFSATTKTGGSTTSTLVR